MARVPAVFPALQKHLPSESEPCLPPKLRRVLGLRGQRAKCQRKDEIANSFSFRSQVLAHVFVGDKLYEADANTLGLYLARWRQSADIAVAGWFDLAGCSANQSIGRSIECAERLCCGVEIDDGFSRHLNQR